MSDLSSVLIVRIDSQTKGELKKLAKKRGHKKISPLVREAVYFMLESDRPDPHEIFQEIRSWREELHRVGINLNRLTHHLNMGLPVSSQELENILKESNKTCRGISEKFKDLSHELRPRL